MSTAELDTLRAAQDRVLEQAGIPMVLALVSALGTVPLAQDLGVRAEGDRLAQQMDLMRAGLIPSMREDDNGALISVLQAVSYSDFGGRDVAVPRVAAALARNEVAE